MSDYSSIDGRALDRWITGDYGEDGVEDEYANPPKPVPCSECNGLGVVDLAPDQPRLDSLRKCGLCNGTGHLD